MTANGNLKRQVRSRAAKTGESYTSALRHVRSTGAQAGPPVAPLLRLAVARTAVSHDPRDTAGLRRSGQEVRAVMRQADARGARLVHFPEGAMVFPHKRIMSVDGPGTVGPADWSRCRWHVLREELGSVARLARQLRLWTVLGCVHPLTPPHRPHNSLYVISDRGRVVTRYDERMLSATKVSFMYTPGTSPITFDVGGLRLGCALGMECHFPELFAEYERLDVDAVLFSTTGPGSVFALQAQAHAATNSYWVSYCASVQDDAAAASGVIDPHGDWRARCADGTASLAIVDVPSEVGNLARPWRRTARIGVYDPPQVHGDRRSQDRCGF
jgi:predicted amidohydrolase